MSDRRAAETHPQGLLEDLPGGVVEAELGEGAAAESQEEGGGVVGIGDVVGQFDDVLVPAGVAVEISEGQRCVGGRAGLFGAPDGSGKIAGRLVKFGDREEHDIVDDPQLCGDGGHDLDRPCPDRGDT